ncbi:SDR family oxidoreductase [uncultured Sphingomonas sp.]|uniref:SDR family oxidoreductase n=1 Tax=uncultured Sphingomonas sp. TaxID=158754 RepID=UPI0025DBC01E|nr:SDR family oxidoreductase [uncultured Sphingomonas sp.]
MASFNLAGRRALVTGASRGIGLSLATALGRAGASVILNGRSTEALDAAVAALRDLGIEADGRCFDVTDPAAVNAGIEGIEADIGAIDVLVNNAGIQRRAPLDQFDDDDWRELMATNLDSVYYVGKAVARRMIPRGRGKIVNIGSVQCELARPGIAPYTASKGAVRNLTRGMCADWARHGLQVNAIGPGYFDTPLNKALVEDPIFDEWLRKRTPAGRWGRLEDLHGAMIFLASDASDFVNGQTLFVDGGITMVL